MNKINFPRKNVDGKSVTKKEIEDWYIGRLYFRNTIVKRVDKINVPTNKEEKKILDFIKNNLKEILLATPEEMETWTYNIDNRRKKLSGDFLNDIKNALNYDYYRKNMLIDLAKQLNVKCCPYCNMHYTLYAEEKGNKEPKLAKFQFDHFYSESQYPMFSMSLYNLIPSCSICNNSKLDKKLTLSYHPYHSDICKQFKFELAIDNPANIFCGQKINDLINVNFIAKDPKKQSELDGFLQTFHLKALYQRHGDIAQEAFDKAYELPYYSNIKNFNCISSIEPEFIKRLWFGTYLNEKDIEKRPLTKFRQDIREQAKIIKLFSKD